MPLKQTVYGGVCPLGKFNYDPASPGSYTADPVEKCINCNFSDTSSKKFDLEKICQCPSDMDWDEYQKIQEDFRVLGNAEHFRHDKLRKQYSSNGGELTKEGFWKFVNQHHKK
jgi:hypothetical protein